MTRILVVEDEPSYLDPLLYQLIREGYEAHGAVTGEEAWALYEEMEFDLVLLDLMLPGVSGTTLCRRMRELRRVPIIMVTAKSTENDVIVGLEIGADDYVTKPYSFRELLSRDPCGVASQSRATGVWRLPEGTMRRLPAGPSRCRWPRTKCAFTVN